jgi:ribosome maturation factor RimP
MRAIFVCMNLLEENIKEIAKIAAEKFGFFLIDTVYRGQKGSRIIEIFIDGESNVSADDCAKVSSEIDIQLENLPDIGSKYRLDVSSPGVDRPLKFLKQFPKHINRKFDVTYKFGEETKNISAKLIKIDGDNLIFFNNSKLSKKQAALQDSATNETIINFNNIINAKVIISFS